MQYIDKMLRDARRLHLAASIYTTTENTHPLTLEDARGRVTCRATVLRRKRERVQDGMC